MKTTTITLENGQELEVNYTQGINESIIAKNGFLYSPWNGITEDFEIEEDFNDLEDMEYTLQNRFEKQAISELEELFKESEYVFVDEVLKNNTGLSFESSALLYYEELLEIAQGDED